MAESISNLKESHFSATRQRRGGTESYYHMNHLGSVSHITDKQGAVVERYSYDVYGAATILNADFEPQTGSAVGNIYYFTGRQLDFETGIYYYRARYYDAVVGRFLQRDPAEADDLLNLYMYCKSNPTGYFDSTGLWCKDVHFYMTYFVGRYVGLTNKSLYYTSSNGQKSFYTIAFMIAWMNQMVDEHPKTMPVKWIGPLSQTQRHRFHFPTYKKGGGCFR